MENKTRINSEELRVAMARQRLNATQLAEKSAVSRATVGLVINESVENPKLETLEQIAAPLGLGVRVEFFPLEEEPALSQ